MPNRSAQVHMEDHMIEDKALLRELEKWDELDGEKKKASDEFGKVDKKIKGKVLNMSLPRGKRRIRCGPFVFRLRDVPAGEKTSRVKAKREVKIRKVKSGG